MTLVHAETGEIVATLSDLEAVIERGIGTFAEVGEALMTIRDQRLYRQDHDTFETYCAERWGFGRRYAYNLIESAEVVSAIAHTGSPAPANEAQARALTPLKDKPEQMAEAMTRATAVTNGKPTAAAIADAVTDLIDAADEQRQNAKELKALAEELQPEGFDEKANAEAVRQRGEFARLCRDLAKLPDPATFVSRQGADLRERHISYAEAAYAWLDGFLLTVREDS